MNRLQSNFNTFIESICSQYGCKDAIGPLQEGFAALCESMTPGNIELVKYFRGLRPSGKEYDQFDREDRDVFHGQTPQFDRWAVHNSYSADRIYREGFKYGSEPGKLAYTDNLATGRFAFATPIENAKAIYWGDRFCCIPYCDGIVDDGAIVFKASGVTVSHRGDGDTQLIFDRNSPVGCFWIRNTKFTGDTGDSKAEDSYEVIGANPDRPLCRGTYDRCIRWCRDNGDASSHMMKRWK